MNKIILASASPRRKEILEQIGIKFEVITSSIKENIKNYEDVGNFVEKLALKKAQNVARRLSPGYLVVGADTIVANEKGILGKPKNKQEAFRMLKELSNKEHTVLTGIAMVETQGKHIVSHEKTSVKFKQLIDDEIWKYINTGEPMDKAGAYGIQGLGAIFVEKIDGCYFNVVGLPIYKFCIMLKEFGIEVLN